MLQSNLILYSRIDLIILYYLILILVVKLALRLLTSYLLHLHLEKEIKPKLLHLTRYGWFYWLLIDLKVILREII
jgi:hypothetical protein